MRIKKIAPVTPANGNIKNSYGTSQTDTYSQEYINKFTDYLTTEQIVGKWVDEKPLYRIVYKSTTYNTVYEMPIANINEIVSVKALVQRGDYPSIYLPVPSRSNVAEWKSDFGNVANINNIKAQVNFTFGTYVETNFGSITIILEYTKTTD